MCDCINEIQKNIPDLTGEYNGKKIISASIQNVTFPMSNLKITGKITMQPVELKVEGRKTSVKTSIAHTYCPFCGEKYTRNKETEVESKNTKSEA